MCCRSGTAVAGWLTGRIRVAAGRCGWR